MSAGKSSLRRLKQVVTPFSEKMGVYGAIGYQIIFEKEIE